MERAKGIEPSYAAWEAAVLPLNYARKINDLARVARPNVLQNVLHFPLALVRRFRAKGKPPASGTLQPCPNNRSPAGLKTAPMMRFLQALTRLNVVALAAIFGGWRGFGGALAYFGIVDRLDRQAAPKPPAAPPAPRPPLPSLSGPDWLQEALTHPHRLVRWSALVLVCAKKAEIERHHWARWAHWRILRAVLRLLFKPRQ